MCNLRNQRLIARDWLITNPQWGNPMGQSSQPEEVYRSEIYLPGKQSKSESTNNSTIIADIVM